MKSVLLIDVDSKIPNLPLMKLSTFFKNKGYNVELKQLNLPYYPYKKKNVYTSSNNSYNYIFASIIFNTNKNYVKGNNINTGGTGVSLTKNLPKSIDKLEPDYSIYPDNTYSYGFITRGCIRNCYFCVVPKKEGYIKQVATIDQIVRHKKIRFLDNNILALPTHKKILQELVDKKIKHCFYQGLDIRLLDEENSYLLSKLNYDGKYIFAFDDWAYYKIISKKIKLLDWAKEDQVKFFIYVHPNMPIKTIINRVEFIREHKFLPYIMRDISCYNSNLKDFYTDYASYCNQPAFFKKLEFEEFLYKRHPHNLNRISKVIKIYKRKKLQDFYAPQGGADETPIQAGF